PDAVTTRPSDSSLAPMSRMESLNFSFQALKAANICCICSGDGLLRPPERGFLARTRYLRLDMGVFLRVTRGRRPACHLMMRQAPWFGRRPAECLFRLDECGEPRKRHSPPSLVVGARHAGW